MFSNIFECSKFKMIIILKYCKLWYYIIKLLKRKYPYKSIEIVIHLYELDFTSNSSFFQKQKSHICRSFRNLKVSRAYLSLIRKFEIFTFNLSCEMR